MEQTKTICDFCHKELKDFELQNMHIYCGDAAECDSLYIPSVLHKDICGKCASYFWRTKPVQNKSMADAFVEAEYTLEDVDEIVKEMQNLINPEESYF